MKNDSNLFKEAIAEAKAVREAAIANAKAALEETITPRLKELLVSKLNEMELEEEEFVDLEEVAKEKSEEKDAMKKNEGKKSEKEDEEPEEKEEEEPEEKESEDASEEEEEVDLPEDLTMDKLEQIITSIVQKELAGEEADLGSDMNDMGDMNDMDNMMDAEASSEEEISLEELLAELEEGEPEDDEPNIDDILSELTQFRKESEKASNKDRQLTEALNTIKSLKQDLTEINLLNAKLLYVNKLMKEFSLSESQVVNIMTAFDKAETVSQAKLVYETVLPSLSKKVKTTVNENRGFASRPAGIAPKKVITESTDVISSEVVNRLQILAGIKKPI